MVLQYGLPDQRLKMTNNRKITLTERTGQALKTKILSGEYPVGSKLPKEKDLIELFQVSRTVVREAMAHLNAEGLLEIRHGVGAFVTTTPQPAGHNGIFDNELQSIAEVLELFELRLGVEIEAAGLAASRRSPAQNAAIREVFVEWRRAIERGEKAADLDLKLHQQIAAATNNRFYSEFLELTAQNAFSRFEQIGFAGRVAEQLNKIPDLVEEHKSVVDAISLQRENEAREAMRHHLRNSEARFREISMRD